LVGSVSKIKKEIKINARLIDIETGKILFAEEVKVLNESLVDKALDKLVKILLIED